MGATGETVRIRAYTPGSYPILVVEPPDGGLRTVYFETGYDLARSKEVGEDWLRENAIGRHGFVAVDPPRESPASSWGEFVNQEISGRPDRRPRS